MRLPSASACCILVLCLPLQTMLALDTDTIERRHYSSSSACNFTGEIVIHHPMSISPRDRYFAAADTMRKSMDLMVSHINNERCGVRLGANGERYSIRMITYGDESSTEKVREIASHIVQETSGNNGNFFLGGYKSQLTEEVASVAQESGRLLLTGGSAQLAVFADRDWVFGTLASNAYRFDNALKALYDAGARSIALLIEEDNGSCSSVESLATKYGYTSVNTIDLPVLPRDLNAPPNQTQVLDTAVAEMSKEDPDLVLMCTNKGACALGLEAMRRADHSPNGVICSPFVHEEADLFYKEANMFPTSWIPSRSTVDAITGWSAADFASEFEAYASRPPSYHGPSAAAVVSILVQAIEAAQSTDEAAIREQLMTRHFPTVYTNISFDENGQAIIPFVLVQYDRNGVPQIVGPAHERTADVVYPMPTWLERDCLRANACEASKGVCLRDGSRVCANEYEYSSGLGLNATCTKKFTEDYSYIDNTLIVFGMAFFAIQAFLSVFTIIWTVVQRNKPIVRASQPIFLVLISVGCLIMVSSILPRGYQVEYRYLKDPVTGDLTEDMVNPDVHSADVACMAAPWLWGIGFTVTFSALLAKLSRIKKVFASADLFRRRQVRPRDVAFVMVGVVGLHIVLLLVWQLVSPLTWQRDVLHVHQTEFTIISVGYCQSESGSAFFLAMILFHIVCLIYALCLCFVTRNISSDFAEGNYISACIVSMFQILAIGLPLLFLFESNTDAIYFVQCAIVFLQCFLVTTLIFGPKIYKLHIVKQTKVGCPILPSSDVKKFRSHPPEPPRRHSFDTGSGIRKQSIFVPVKSASLSASGAGVGGTSVPYATNASILTGEMDIFTDELAGLSDEPSFKRFSSSVYCPPAQSVITLRRRNSV